MTKQIKKIGVLTSGGDAPGMNAAIRAVTRRAIDAGLEVVAIYGGYSGLINEKIVPLQSRSVANIITYGGTVLYSDRCVEFKTEEGMQKAIATCKKHGIDAIVAIGGDGTFRGATDLTMRGIPAVGVPGTIDNDITATDYTIGFDTAMNTSLDAIDRLRNTCESHARCNIIELMGRHCGEIALETAIAGGAVACAIPEVPFDDEACIERINLLKAHGKRGMIVVVSEGVLEKDGVPYGEALAEEIANRTGVNCRFVRLAHVVRGGNPTLRDRSTASKMGAAAVDLLLAGESNRVICEIDGQITSVDIAFALITDRMYKNKLKDGDLDAFTPEQIKEMEAICEKRRNDVKMRYELVNALAN